MTEKNEIVLQLTELPLMTFEDVLKLFWAIILFAFVSYIISRTAKFFPAFVTDLANKYKYKRNLETDYNIPFQNLNKSFPTGKKEIKKNHGKRIPFFNKR